MAKTAVIYWSGSGNTEAMAAAVAQSANADIFNVSEISPQDASSYDKIAFGCPAMGDEVLEEGEFEPFFAEVETALSGKKIALFGSYGWGDGTWMRNWEDRVRAAGATLVADGLIINGAPDDSGLEECSELAKALADA